MTSLDQQLRLELEARHDADLRRTLRVMPPNALDLASNDYLGLARHPDVIEAACRATREFGAGARASRLVSGHTILHERLERELAFFKGCEAALLFPSGYAANLAVVSALARRGDVILCDKRNHASLVDGCRLACSQGAHIRYYGSIAKLRALLRRMSTHGAAPSDAASGGDAAPDSDVTTSNAFATNAADELPIGKSSTRRIIIVSDAVYSMDGDVADVPALHDLAREFNATLLLDDAHGTGTLGETGRGALEHFGLIHSEVAPSKTRLENSCHSSEEEKSSRMSTHAARSDNGEEKMDAIANRDVSNIIQIGTLSKALGGQGGFVAGSQTLIDWLINVARPFVYTTALAPPLCGAALEALRIVQNEPERVARLHCNVAKLSRALRDLGFDVPHRDAPILPVVAGSASRALAWSDYLARQGIWCPAIRPPTVARGTSRLRLSVSSELNDNDIARIRNAFQSLKSSVFN